jgi:hypothetical protein
MSFWFGVAVVVAVILIWGLVADLRRRGGWARGVSDDSWKARDEAGARSRLGGWMDRHLTSVAGQLGAVAV